MRIILIMPTRVIVLDRVILCVAIPVPCLRIARFWHDTIRLRKAGQRRAVEARLIVHQAEVVAVIPLAGIAEVGLGDIRRTADRPRLPEGHVSILAKQVPAAVHHDRGRAEVVAG